MRNPDIGKTGLPRLGRVSSGFYSYTRGGPENAAFLDAFAKTVNGKSKPSFLAAAFCEVSRCQRVADAVLMLHPHCGRSIAAWCHID